MPTYQIPDENLGALLEKLEKLSKRAEKLQSGKIEYSVGDFETVKVSENEWVKLWTVEVSGESPSLNGWQFVARVDHLPEGNVINKLSNEIEIPQRYRTTDYTLCEHCNTRRERNNTYLVRHDDGSFKQVGSTCLKDFVGWGNPEAVAELAEAIANLSVFVSEFGYDPDMERGEPSLIDLRRYMSYVSMIVDGRGFTPRSRAHELNPATSDLAVLAMFEKYNKQRPSENNRETAKNIIDYIRSIEPTINQSEYIWNLRAIMAEDYIDYKHLGYAASAISVYNRYLEEQAKRDDSASEYQGTAKQRQEWGPLTVTKVVTLDGYYGASYLHIMQDESGNVFVWISSKYQYEIGDKVQGKGTVKEHKEYRGVKQTVLTRCQFEVMES